MADPNVLNPGFEADLASWTKNDGDASVTWTRDGSITHNASLGSSKLDNTVAGADDYIFQDLNNLGQGFTPGTTHTVSAWYNVTSFTAGAVSNRGIFIVTFPSSFVFSGPTITAVTADWVNSSVTFALGPIETGFEIRLYSPQGTIFWDDVARDLAPLGAFQ